MAIVAVQDFRREEKDNIDDLLNKVGKGLQIAQAVYGFKTAGEQSDLRQLQMEREKQVLESGKLQLEEQKKKAGYAAGGIIPSGDFNKEYRAITPEKITQLEDQYQFDIEPIHIKVEDPTSDKGYTEVLALPRDELEKIRSYIQTEKLTKIKLEGDKATKLALQAQKASEKLATKPAGEQSFLPKKVDEEFSKEFARYKAKGQEVLDFDSVRKLEETISTAEKVLDTGWDEQVMGIMPEQFRSLLDPEDKAIEDRLKAVAQTSMKEILGAQFTEKEGKLVLDRAYNPAMPKEENIRRMKELARSLRDKAQAKKLAMDYFAQHGSLQGFQGPTSTQVIPTRQEAQQSKTFMGGFQTEQKPETDKDFINKYLSE